MMLLFLAALLCATMADDRVGTYGYEERKVGSNGRPWNGWSAAGGGGSGSSSSDYDYQGSDSIHLRTLSGCEAICAKTTHHYHYSGESSYSSSESSYFEEEALGRNQDEALGRNQDEVEVGTYGHKEIKVGSNGRPWDGWSYMGGGGSGSSSSVYDAGSRGVNSVNSYGGHGNIYSQCGCHDSQTQLKTEVKREVNVGSEELKNEKMLLSIPVARPSDYVLLPLACVGFFSMVYFAFGKCGFQHKVYGEIQNEVEDV